MKDLVPNLLKTLGIVLVSAFILFLFYPKDRIKDQVVNAALEVLGNKLLAMVPQEKEWQVQQEFEAMRAEALEGKIDEEHLEQFAAVVLNAEAEGRALPLEKIDSSLVALRHVEIKLQKDEQRLQKFAHRMHAFEKFQARWEHAFSDSEWTGQPPLPRRPFYRVDPNFVVKIDTAAIAAVVAAHTHPPRAESVTVISLKKMPPLPPLPPRIEIMLKELAEISQDLPVQLEYRFTSEPDSFHFEHHLPPAGSTFVKPVP